MKIFKYTLANLFDNVIELPKGSEILCVQMQGDALRLWALVDHANEKEERKFIVYWTGQTCRHSKNEYIGTVKDGLCVWHVFEERNP